MNKGFVFTDEQMNKGFEFIADLNRITEQPEYYTDEARQQAFYQWQGARRLLRRMGFTWSEIFNMTEDAEQEYNNKFKVTA